MTATCNKCGSEVPSENLVLHELRCRGLPQRSTAGEEARATAAAAAPLPPPAAPMLVPSAPPLPADTSVVDVEMEGVDSATGTEATWACQRCTYENAVVNDFCEMCEASRYRSSDIPGRFPDSAFHEHFIGGHGVSEPSLRPPDQAFHEQLIGGHPDMAHSIGPPEPGMPDFMQGALGGALVGGALGLLGGRGRVIGGALSGALQGGLFADALGRMRAMHDEGTALRQQRRPMVNRGYPRQRVVMIDGNPHISPFMHPHPFARFNEMERLQEMLAQAQSQEPQMRPANDHVITTLPIHRVTAEELAAMPEEHRACTICMEDFQEGDEQRTLPCFHRFHRGCVDTWLGNSGTCPICKHRVDGVEDDAHMAAHSVREGGA